MTDGYHLDEGEVAALAKRLASAEGVLGDAAGGDPDADAGRSTGALMAAAGLQAQSLSALAQGLSKASAETNASVADYREVEASNAEGLTARMD